MAKPKIFVSHSSLDTTFATKLVNDLKAAGADAWMDVNDLGAGNFQQRISQALANCEWFLLVLTRNALESDWVRMEVDAAIRLKHQKRIKELIFIKAGDVEQHEAPALWGVFNILDAVTDYKGTLSHIFADTGLGFDLDFRIEQLEEELDRRMEESHMAESSEMRKQLVNEVRRMMDEARRLYKELHSRGVE